MRTAKAHPALQNGTVAKKQPPSTKMNNKLHIVHHCGSALLFWKNLFNFFFIS